MTNNVVAIDTETTIYNKGNVYGCRNSLVCYSVATREKSWAERWDYKGKGRVEALMNNCLVAGFNFKFDVGWLRKAGVDFTNVKVWDVQIAEFILSCQLHKFPSLNDTCIKYGIPVKLDVVKTEYWDKGIDTQDIPWPILSAYAAHDAKSTLECYYAQIKLMTPAQIKLCKLMSQDMLVLQEMEQNGLKYDEQLCSTRSEQLTNETENIKQTLSAFYPNIPINFNSGDDLSTFLYGGTIVQDIKIHDGFFKTGIKKGQPKLKNATVEHYLPPLFSPVKGSELKKEGFYETNEGVLRKLIGPNKSVVDKLLSLAGKEKLNGTYYKGLPKLNAEMHWPAGRLHGQFNQTLAKTGRLSSSRPNQQNFATEIQDIFISEYE